MPRPGKALRLFLTSWMGLIGLSLLLILVLLALSFSVIGSEEAIRNWRNYEYWADYPKKTPPCLFARNVFPTQVIEGYDVKGYELLSYEVNDLAVHSYRIAFTVENSAPSDIIIRFNVTYEAPTYVYMALVRPDGLVLNLTEPYESPRLSSVRSVFGTPTTSYNGTVYRSLSSYIDSPGVSARYLGKWLEALGVPSLEELGTAHEGLSMLFARKTPEGPSLLEGEYVLRLDFVSKDPGLETELVRVAFLGGCYGVLGTDAYGRDLWQGVLYGVRWALIIGLLVAFASTVIGGVYGIISGYIGRVVDELLLRVAQIVYSIPVLPLLIILSYLLKPSIWNLVLLLTAFGWPGIALVTRSMALQIKEEMYVEAARAIGASSARIIFRYIFPQTLPYLFASMALSVPGAILTEAAISFLGLGDPTKITWGRILNEAQANMATINGYWWWVLPPGLMIVLTGMTFVLLGYALDRVLNPRLRR